MVIKMADLIKQNQGIYNYSISIEIIRIFINKNDLYIRVIEQNIIVETRKRWGSTYILLVFIIYSFIISFAYFFWRNKIISKYTNIWLFTSKLFIS